MIEPASRCGRVQVELLGAFRLAVDGVDVDLPAGSQRLVALLALRGRCSRSRVAGTLWPDSTEQRALACLRTAIWRANQAAGELVRSRVGILDLAADVGVDVRGQIADARAVIEGTDDLPSGGLDDLLPEWGDDWLDADRERLRQLHLHMLEAQAERLTSEHRFGLALEAALGALRIDPFRESAHRTVIRIHLAEGNIGEAWRSYRRCADLLEREMGVAPTAETRRLLHPAGGRDVSVTVG